MIGDMAPPALFFLVSHPILWLFLVAIWLLPAIVAFARGHRHPWVILLLNLFFAWTGIVWLGTLIWALVGRPHHHVISGPPGSHVGMISPDGRWTWDGRRWVPLGGPPAPPY
jgi:hypothetical protein